MKLRAANDHAHATELDADVRRLGEQAYVIAPCIEGFPFVSDIGADADDATEMVQHDGQFRNRLRHGCQFPDLAVVEHCVKTETVFGQRGQTGSEIRVGEHIWRRRTQHDPVRKMGVARYAVPHAPEPPRRRHAMRIQHFSNAFAEREVGKAYDACTGFELVCVLLRCIRDFLDPLGFPDAPKRLRPGGPVAVVCLDKHGGDHLVAR